MSAEQATLHADGRADAWRVRVLSGPDVLEQLGAPLDELLAAAAAPVTARRPWLSAWNRCHTEYRPLAVAVEDREGRLDAVALLGQRRRFGIDEFVAMGHGPSDMARLPARTPRAASSLAAAVADRLASHGRRWQLVVRHLPDGDAVAEELARRLRCAELVAGDAAPALRFGPNRSLGSSVSGSHLQQLHRMRNRLAKDGLAPAIEHLRDPAAIRAALPEVEEVSRQRDISMRGTSSLERQGSRRFFGQVILDHAARGEVELTTVRLRGELAAYTLCFLDRGAHRVWSCKLSPDFARYGAGRIANDAALRRALDDAACSELDWMRGEETYKLGLSNHVERMRDLLAWSSPAVKLTLYLRRRVRDRLKQIASRHAALRAAVRAARRIQLTGRRSLRVLRGVLGGWSP